MQENSTGSVVERIRSNARLQETDALGALADAEQMVEEFGPHPMALARLAAVQLATGAAEALDTARRSADVARSVGNYGVLADLYEAFGEELDALDFELHERMRMAQSLTTRGHFPAALKLYTQIFEEHAGYMPAVKELVQLSDNCLRQDALLETALEIYNLLDRSCPGHPFEAYTEQGREEAQRRLARSH